MKELGKQFPSIKKVLVDERDSFIAEMIKHSPGKKIVAVVGAGHLEGIIDSLEKNKKVDLKEITSIPKKKSFLKYIGLLIPALLILLFGYGLFTKGIETTLSMLLYWAIITGVCSALGAIISRAHPLSILAALVSAPITTIHPALAAGWVAGLVEARFNPPRVIDFEELPQVATIRGFYKNKVTHILIVAALTNVGATIGTILAFPALAALLA
jgi:pheromone shutdown-related protein TraB